MTFLYVFLETILFVIWSILMLFVGAGLYAYLDRNLK